jgi:alkylhydroperoxidase/carboxymuconolactone decarboxylase family protein YurZ
MMQDERDLRAEEEALKRRFVAARGYWRPWCDFLLRHHPDFLELYARYAGHAAAKGPLPRKAVELVYVALDGSATHLFRSGLVLHMRLALEAGASVREILDTLRLATAQGLHGTTAGITILAEEMAALAPDAAPDLSDRHAALEKAYVARHGEWPSYCAYLAEADPDFLALMQELNGEEDGAGLDAETTHYIEIALAGCFTGFMPDALRAAIRRALAGGIGADAILQVLQMTAHLGVHSCSVGVPALEEALDAHASG